MQDQENCCEGRRTVADTIQAQTIAGDMRSQELIALLQRERQQEIITTRSQIAYRYQAEDVLDDAQLFKVETVGRAAYLKATCACSLWRKLRRIKLIE